MMVEIPVNFWSSPSFGFTSRCCGETVCSKRHSQSSLKLEQIKENSSSLQQQKAANQEPVGGGEWGFGQTLFSASDCRELLSETAR
ncbi:Protein of unknown function [Gryllus bimaculatus]|nr:Protein of unknown function [Gryllus bimaculatus]